MMNDEKLKTETNSPNKPRNEAMAVLLQKIADAGGVGISNPEEWQREIRQDRPLPFRDK